MTIHIHQAILDGVKEQLPSPHPLKSKTPNQPHPASRVSKIYRLSQ
ncbi:hypothetical protein ACWOBE_08090 [Hutsoniella sourekii]